MDGYRIGKTLNLNPQVHVHHTWRAPCPNKGNTARQAARSIATPDWEHCSLAVSSPFHRLPIPQNADSTEVCAPLHCSSVRRKLDPAKIFYRRYTWAAVEYLALRTVQAFGPTDKLKLTCTTTTLWHKSCMIVLCVTESAKFCCNRENNMPKLLFDFDKKTYSTHTSFFHLIYLEMFEE